MGSEFTGWDIGGNKDDNPLRVDSSKSLADLPGCILGDKTRYENFSNEALYQFEVLLRDFFEKQMDDPYFKRSRMARRFTLGQMVEILFGRKWDNEIDSVNAAYYSRVLNHYSVRIQQGGSAHGKKTSKNIYTLSITRYKKVKPYSLKLRMEHYILCGVVPNAHNMQVYKKTLNPGRSRVKWTNDKYDRIYGRKEASDEGAEQEAR